ncbi:MAG: nickel-dependent lactate racemase [Deltaproteobacteria bacterium]|nr:nickel-dependent lactate racemase [Deltaproteobacteria bacterium]
MKQKYSVLYSKGDISFDLPAGMRGDVAVSKTFEPVTDVESAIGEALARPTGTPSLSKMAHTGDSVCIIFTDITRSCPEHLLVPAMLRELERAGVRDRDITLLCGIGMHRPSTYEEKIFKLGKDVVTRYNVIDNEPRNQEMLVDLGFTLGGVPVTAHRAAVTADLVIATGIVEPHQYAGYSGGRKTAAVGAAGEALIAHTHGPVFAEHPGTRLGCIEGNPFHEAITEAAQRVGLRFIINVVMDDNKRILKVAAGEPDTAFRELVSFARSVFEVPIVKQYDVAIGGVGFPKDANLYQASRAASYLFFAPTPVVKKGGYIIIPARCEEGAGDGVGEQRFLDAMRDSPDVQYILDDARKNGYPPGQQRAFVMAKVLEEAQVVIVGSECPDIIESCKMIAARTMEDALALVERKMGSDIDVLIVPHALLTLPILTETK